MEWGTNPTFNPRAEGDGYAPRLPDVTALPKAPTLPRAEADPTFGANLKAPGAKADAGKNRMALVLGGFATALTKVSEVGTFGANKYTDHGWRVVPNAEQRYMDAALRHMFEHLRGEASDSDSGLPHLAHAAWNLLAVMELRDA